MNTHIRKRLEQLRADYESVSDRPWHFFYCPILHRDEETELCAGHVINQALEDTDRSWTVQRKDVDNHYGTLFEGDFMALEKKSLFKLMRFWQTENWPDNSIQRSSLTTSW